MSDLRLADDQLDQLAALIAEKSRPRLIGAEEAAAVLGVPRSWVLAEARAGRIPHVRLGKYVRFAAPELEAWWSERTRGPQRRSAAR